MIYMYIYDIKFISENAYLYALRRFAPVHVMKRVN